MKCSTHACFATYIAYSRQAQMVKSLLTRHSGVTVQNLIHVKFQIHRAFEVILDRRKEKKVWSWRPKMLPRKRLTLNCTYNEINSLCYRLENIWNLRVAMMGLTLCRSPQLDVLKSYIILLTEKLGMHEFMTLAFFKRVPNSLKWLTL